MRTIRDLRPEAHGFRILARLGSVAAMCLPLLFAGCGHGDHSLPGPADGSDAVTATPHADPPDFRFNVAHGSCSGFLDPTDHLVRHMDEVLLVEVVGVKAGSLEPMMMDDTIGTPDAECSEYALVPTLELDVIVLDTIIGQSTPDSARTIHISANSVTTSMWPPARFHPERGLLFAWEDQERSPFTRGEQLLVFAQEDAAGELVATTPYMLGVYGHNTVHGLDHGEHAEELALMLGMCTRPIAFDSQDLDAVADTLRQLHREGLDSGVEREFHPPRLGSICFD